MHLLLAVLGGFHDLVAVGITIDIVVRFDQVLGLEELEHGVTRRLDESFLKAAHGTRVVLLVLEPTVLRLDATLFLDLAGGLFLDLHLFKGE